MNVTKRGLPVRTRFGSLSNQSPTGGPRGSSNVRLDSKVRGQLPRLLPTTYGLHRVTVDFVVGRYYDPQTGQFLSVDPAVQQTQEAYRLLMRASDALGNPAGVRSAMGRLAAVLEDDVQPLESVHPETRALYEVLMRRRRPEVPPDVMASRRSSGSSARSARSVRQPDAKPGVATDLDDHRRRLDHRP